MCTVTFCSECVSTNYYQTKSAALMYWRDWGMGDAISHDSFFHIGGSCDQRKIVLSANCVWLEQLRDYFCITNLKNVELKACSLLKYLNSFQVLDSCTQLVWEELHVTMATHYTKITQCTVVRGGASKHNNIHSNKCQLSMSVGNTHWVI